MPRRTQGLGGPQRIVQVDGIDAFDKAELEMMGPWKFRPGVYRRKPGIFTFTVEGRARGNEKNRARLADVPLPELSFLRRG